MGQRRPEFWEDFKVDDRFQTVARTITETDLVMWSGLTGDYLPMHTDVEYARNTEFGERIAHGPLTFAYVVGLVVRSGILDDTLMAWLGINAMQIPRPVRIGDTIHVEIEVVETRQSRKPDRGVTILRYHAMNQHGEEVMTCDMAFLMHRKPQG